LLHDTASAEDALQDAFVKLWGRYRICSVQEAEALLSRTVRNNSVDCLRRRKSVPLEENDFPDDNADQTNERERLFRKVEQLVQDELTDIQKYIIRRHEYEGIKLELIAQELGMNPPAVRMQLSRARKTLREKYYEQSIL